MKNSENCWTVYRHITPSGKSYIGITSQKPEDRWQNGRGYRKDKQRVFYNAIEKYKWENIKHEILDTNLTEDEAKRLEKEYIEKYRTFVDFPDCNGYNCTLGGEGTVGWEPSEETKRKQSEAHMGIPPWNKGKTGVQIAWNKGKTGVQVSWNKGKTGVQVSWNKGKTTPEETRKKISESKKGKPSSMKGKKLKPLSDETKKKISEGNKGKPSHRKGIPNTEEHNRKISASLKGKPSHRKGKHLIIIDGKRFYE